MRRDDLWLFHFCLFDRQNLVIHIILCDVWVFFVFIFSIPHIIFFPGSIHSISYALSQKWENWWLRSQIYLNLFFGIFLWGIFWPKDLFSFNFCFFFPFSFFSILLPICFLYHFISFGWGDLTYISIFYQGKNHVKIYFR